MSSDLGWWVIRGESLLRALRSVAEGENPDIIFAELYANSNVEEYKAIEESEGEISRIYKAWWNKQRKLLEEGS